MKDAIKDFLPRPTLYLYRFLRDRKDAASVLRFIRREFPGVNLSTKLGLVHSLYKISDEVECPHTQSEILSYVEEILSLGASDRQGIVVEAGCFKGGSTAKFSLAADLAGRKLIVFDSFEGIPKHSEDHRSNIFGDGVGFPEGSYRGDLDEVKTNVSCFGRVDVCDFRKGWFDKTMPNFDEKVAAAYIDVDLASSTYTCLRFLYPLLQVGGSIFSQDGHLPLVIDVFRDQEFWQDEFGIPPPMIEGLGQRKLIRLVKPSMTHQ